MKNALLVSHIVSLLIGGWIYLLFRDSSLLLFEWMELFGEVSLLDVIRAETIAMGTALPSWVLYSLPDGLWLFSYVCLVLHIWRNALTSIALIWVFLLPALAILQELLQAFQIVNGTFDPVDLIFYCITTALPFALFRKRINLVQTQKTA